jgi:hypothetical protein
LQTSIVVSRIFHELEGQTSRISFLVLCEMSDKSSERSGGVEMGQRHPVAKPPSTTTDRMTEAENPSEAADHENQTLSMMGLLAFRRAMSDDTPIASYHRSAPTISNIAMLHRTIQAVGIVYGDIGEPPLNMLLAQCNSLFAVVNFIFASVLTTPLFALYACVCGSGTSPLYTMSVSLWVRDIFNFHYQPHHMPHLVVVQVLFNGQQPSESDILGGLSTILWLLIAVVCIKYISLVLRADAHGEVGGTQRKELYIENAIKYQISNLAKLFHQINYPTH